jgi:ATP-dependent 26S proteasome regulatory subunit
MISTTDEKISFLTDNQEISKYRLKRKERLERKKVKKTDRVTVTHENTQIEFFFEPNSEMKMRMMKRCALKN